MARFLKSRLVKLEQRGKRPSVVRNTVLTIDALTGAIIGPKPKRHFMVVADHGTDDEWQVALLAQQARLITEASVATEEGTAQ
ncbi:hypothetical protein [Anianabacter salinae]|uniref:hypothetical protein n=1 Tax=Anianabacter salinae TaxID=2851023 RepID=UPI00225DD6A4|nr:hypothetical protein [Anianabacter salinae]MBV0910923.1 hypothetical protein [Anianabacter salinae]